MTTEHSNPFRDGPHAGNMTEQMRMIRERPVDAFRMMGEAGFSPTHWGIRDTTKHGVEVTGDVWVENPFIKGPGKGNQTAQHRAIKENPEAAFKQMLEAGFEPSEWGVDIAAHGFTLVAKEETAA